MSGDRSALSQTLSGLKGKCDSCPAISRLAIIVDNTKDTVRDMQDSVSTTREDIAEIRGILSQLPSQLSDVKDSMRHEIKAAMRAAVLSAGGSDPDKTRAAGRLVRPNSSSPAACPGEAQQPSWPCSWYSPQWWQRAPTWPPNGDRLAGLRRCQRKRLSAKPRRATIGSAFRPRVGVVTIRLCRISPTRSSDGSGSFSFCHSS